MLHRGHVPQLESLTLRDRALLLRPWTEEDAPTLKAVCGDAEVCRFTTVPWTYSLARAREWVHRQRAHAAAGTGVVLAITCDAETTPVGSVNLLRSTGDVRQATLGYWLVPEARGRGLVTTAAALVCAWGFDEMNLARIELAILSENDRSHRVAERLGAAREGLRRGSHFADHRAWDVVIYSLARNPYRAER